LAIAFLASCQSRTWDPDNPPDEVEQHRFVVLFAPMEPGPLEEHYPAASEEMSRRMTIDVNTFSRDAAAYYAGSLPPSGDPVWKKGEPVGSAGGAHFVVLTTVEELDREERAGTATNPQQVFAHVTMEVYGVDGERRWYKELKGRADNVTAAKMMSDASKPRSRAVWSAVSKGLKGMRTWLAAVPTVPPDRHDPSGKSVEKAPMVTLQVSSNPEGANIFVDGLFHGNTPAKVPMSVRKHTLRLEHPGYQVFEVEMMPKPDMPIDVPLEPLKE